MVAQDRPRGEARLRVKVAIGEKRALDRARALSAQSATSAAAARPSAASPMVPVTQIDVARAAVVRSTMRPAGTSPNAVTARSAGRGVRTVSPPSSGQAKSVARRRRGRRRRPPANPRSSPRAAPESSRKPRGSAPLAARSETFTPSAFRAIESGGSSGRKCTASTIASIVRTRSCPGLGDRQAASSRRAESRPPRPAARNSARSGRPRRPDGIDRQPPILALPRSGGLVLSSSPPRTSRAMRVEHGVDHARLVLRRRSRAPRRHIR